MITLEKFVLKDVRCFEGTQKFNIRPLTFLVGENSTGKSTVLGCMQALSNFAGRNLTKDSDFNFNIDPYQMGAFADIARKIGGRGDNRKIFELGFEMQVSAKERIHLLVTLIERESGSEPTIKKLEIDFGDVQVVYIVQKKNYKVDDHGEPSSEEPTISDRDGKRVYTFKIENEVDLFFLFRFRNLMIREGHARMDTKYDKLLCELEKDLSRFAKTLLFVGYDGIHTLFPPYNHFYFESFAPIRSKPERTYDPLKEVEDPEGRGMPMTLMNMSRGDKEAGERMRKELVKFGKASGLFTDIQVRKLGWSVNDPFQIRVKAIGPKTNIINVGYGVSQILPILVRIIQASQKTFFLVQQPEIHLHPRGQAELVSFLVHMQNERKVRMQDEQGVRSWTYGPHSFIFETHSDAMINRARIEILSGKLDPDDLSLIYLEPKGNKVEVHNISFDTEANMIGVPNSYRRFFLKEHDKLLGFED